MSKKKKQKEKQQKKSFREQKLPGWMEDAEVLDIHRKAPMIRTISEVVYSQIIGKREARQLRMTVLIPDTGAAKPAVLFFPGGGWLGAAKDRFAENRWALAEAGFVVATAEYRTIPAGFPAQVVDGKTALRFLRAHAADFEIDTDRIGVMGNSAGGWLAEMVALSTHTREWTSAEWGDESEAVSACCALHPVSNLIGIGEGLDPDAVAAHDSESSPEALLVNGVSFTGRGDGPIASVPEKAEAASPAGLLIRKPADVKAPPFLLIHGTADRMVSPAQSAHMAELLKEAHVPFRYYLLEGVDHSSDPAWYQEPICDLIVKFFENKLGD